METLKEGGPFILSQNADIPIEFVIGKSSWEKLGRARMIFEKGQRLPGFPV